MDIVSTHSHLLSNPEGLDQFVESGLLSQVWILELPQKPIKSMEARPATEDEILEVCRRYAGFFLPFKWVDFRSGPDQIDRAVEKGFVGFKGFCPQKPYDDDSYMPIYERISSYKTCMVFHTGYVSTPRYEDRGELGYSALNMCPATLYKIARFFPEMTLVAAHFGVPWEHELVAGPMPSLPNLYIDFSGGEYEYLLKFMEEAASCPATLADGSRGMIANKLLFGVDAYLGMKQLHHDVESYVKDFLRRAEILRTGNLPWSCFLGDMLAGNSRKLLAYNQLFHS